MIETGCCEFSADRKYRYVLIRELTDPMVNVEKPLGSFLLVIGLNPSTADETKNDPTIRRCIGFANRWGFRKLVMMNIFGFRATDPKDMMKEPAPIGPLNDQRLREIAKHCKARCGQVLAAWGNHGSYLNRSAEVTVLLQTAGVDVLCLGTTSTGQPCHPLYIPADTMPVKYP